MWQEMFSSLYKAIWIQGTPVVKHCSINKLQYYKFIVINNQ